MLAPAHAPGHAVHGDAYGRVCHGPAPLAHSRWQSRSSKRLPGGGRQTAWRDTNKGAGAGAEGTDA
ncbi:hypothetical protein Scani_62940 [Streptomyces caniferus]|uniref:Uncharacterized protein n=1 Tax=Streptomyces caniferus TaxID=285557 RepID=A0A640SIN9_9ACTN|nr:hypothetical protein Scani_62940 [Streptomyces caniferus]